MVSLKKFRSHLNFYKFRRNFSITPDGFQYVIENNEVFIKGLKKKSHPEEIPAYIEDLPVVYLAGLHNLPLAGEVRIPDTVRELEWAVFNVQESATKFILPENLTRIDEHAFAWCKSLEEIVFPDSVTSLGLGTVISCKKLRAVRLPEHLEEIPDFFASGCTALEDITIPAQVSRIGEMAFNECVSLKKIILPDDLKYIDKYAFAGCTNLEYPVIPAQCEVHPKAFHA
ncbi:MAG: leucine-rich repeat protein [Oscillospiraceae bacterium]|nr:leucine-rich repeat protein [Oscillospiraceae bacterium]